MSDDHELNETPKHKKKKKKFFPSGKPVGRPSVMTEEVIRKIEFAASRDFTIKETCLFAGISHMALYSYFKDNPDFYERFNTLKSNMTLRAKLNISEEILTKKDVDRSAWYLERRQKDLFSTKVEQSVDAKIQHNFETMTDEELDAELEQLAKF